jgi:hypothetical protein
MVEALSNRCRVCGEDTSDVSLDLLQFGDTYANAADNWVAHDTCLSPEELADDLGVSVEEAVEFQQFCRGEGPLAQLYKPAPRTLRDYQQGN